MTPDVQATDRSRQGGIPDGVFNLLRGNGRAAQAAEDPAPEGGKLLLNASGELPGAEHLGGQSAQILDFG
jgi:hypothetical protein